LVALSVARNEMAERRLLASILQDARSCEEDGLSSVTEDLFTSGFTIAVWRAMVATREAGEAITLATIAPRLDRSVNALEVAVLPESIPSAASFVDYLVPLRRCAARRIVVRAMQAAIHQAADPKVPLDDLTLMLAEAQRDAQEMARSDTCRHVAEFVPGARRSILSGPAEAIPTSIPPLDAILHGGFRSAQLIVLAARPSVGKTSLALNVAKNIAAGAEVALFVSMEMSGEELAVKLLLIECDTAGPTEDDLERAASRVQSLSIHIDDGLTGTLQQTTAAITRSVRRTGATLVVVDYLGLIPPDVRNASAYERVSAASREIKILARRLGVPILLLCQLNREVESRKGPPKLHDLRDSGTIEQDADVVILLDRNSPPGPEVIVDLHVAKNRNGPLGTVPILFKAEVSRFVANRTGFRG
jgi:replicative DNA helicase